ncbi:FKBP-type peptidyl-prolyl cis-trans isomerase [Micromonospora sp. NPDC049523]|uniref:FKBP-type peptidyl-prolyl cis-trans isomerase n=1 Tax=Micromonospora sp. NPDC049523 TaxID=3155921 RepID=UPI00342E43C6
MSDQVQSHSSYVPSEPPPLTKSEKRALAKAAKAKAAARKRRNQALAGAFAGLAVVAVIVVAFVALDDTGKEPADNGVASVPSATAPADPAAPPAQPPADAEFPPLPEGADPALGKEPVVTKGEGELTKLTSKALIEGTGPVVQAGQQITVNYVGVTYKDGQEFDSSWKQSRAVPFQIGTGQVIPGWDQGLVGVKVGSRIQLDIPPALAYGDNPGNGAPAGALRFVVDVLAAQ